MKKSMMIVALLGASSAATANSSLTVFGIADTALTRISGSDAGSRTGLSSGGNAASRLGLRGTEDLGAGLSAGFWLESAVGLDTGGASGLTFQRRSTVSLTGPWGELRLGRDYAPIWWNIALLDPYGARGVGTSQAFNNFGYNAIWNSNSIGYFLPGSLGGLYGQVQIAFGEKTASSPNKRQGDAWGGRLGYASGPLNIAVAYTEYKQVIGASDVAPVTIGRHLRMANIGASWDFGWIKPMAYYGVERVPGAPAGANRLDSLLLGATAPLGNGELRATVARYDLKQSGNDFTKLAIGYGYSLSRRTQLYATVARLSNQGASTRSLSADGMAALGGIRGAGHSTGVDFGIRHSF